MTTAETCACPSCSSATLVGSQTAGFCTACGSLSLAGTAVPLVAVVLLALAARALVLAHVAARKSSRFQVRSPRARLAAG